MGHDNNNNNGWGGLATAVIVIGLFWELVVGILLFLEVFDWLDSVINPDAFMIASIVIFVIVVIILVAVWYEVFGTWPGVVTTTVATFVTLVNMIVLIVFVVDTFEIASIPDATEKTIYLRTAVFVAVLSSIGLVTFIHDTIIGSTGGYAEMQLPEMGKKK